MRTRVCITIDTEFSIGGAFANPARSPIAEPMVYCKVKGRSEGLGFMLDMFRQYGIQATFFVETLQRQYFKHDPMRAIVREIRDEGHEVELHLHPCWNVFQHEDWQQRVRTLKRPDDFFGRPLDESVKLLQAGIDTFEQWGLPRPKAFRSGNLQHDANLYRALAAVSIPYSSNVGTAIFDSGDPNYQLYSGQHERHGVIECPVLSFSDWSLGTRQHVKSLTIAGTSFGEMRTLLTKARLAGIQTVVILTHPFEYVHTRDASFAHTRTQYVTQQRLRKLCQYLQQNDDAFEACGLVHALEQDASTSPRNELLSVSLSQSLPRMAEQVIYDKYSRWALKRKTTNATYRP